jgi:hypothetical protein
LNPTPFERASSRSSPIPSAFPVLACGVKQGLPS